MKQQQKMYLKSVNNLGSAFEGFQASLRKYMIPRTLREGLGLSQPKFLAEFGDHHCEDHKPKIQEPITFPLLKGLDSGKLFEIIFFNSSWFFFFLLRTQISNSSTYMPNLLTPKAGAMEMEMYWVVAYMVSIKQIHNFCQGFFFEECWILSTLSILI